MALRTAETAASALLRADDGGAMDPVAYDTAWVARLGARGNPRQALFPEAGAWLLRAQRGDGSWGAEAETLHDRVAATLAAVTTLSGLLRRQVALPERPDAVGGRVEAGLGYLHRRAAGLAGDPWETVGFELAVPALLAEARALGLRLPWEAFAVVAERREAKLRALPPGWQGRPGAAMAHTLEGWGEGWPERLASLRGPDGSCANSPSATAFYYSRIPDETARAYLRACVASGGGGVPDVQPFDVFEAAWILDHLALGGVPAPDGPLLARLEAAWGDGERGVGIASSGLEPDADDTALCAVVLHRAGRAVHARALGAFRRPGGFATFPFERNPSVSANIHVAYALQALEPGGGDANLEAIRGFLADTRRPEGCWLDKWHASPWYPTCRAVVALDRVWPDLVAPAVDWLLEGQRPDGSWGLFSGTAEETAYAVEALARVGGPRRAAAAAALGRAGRYLGGADGPRPALWIGKGLYHPRRVVAAAVLAARRLCARRGGTP